MLKSKTYQNSVCKSVSGALALVLAMGAFSAAEANSSRSNASQVKDVTLSQPGINFHVKLENKANNKHINNIDIQPMSDVMAFPLKGFVQCAKDKSVSFSSAKVYFGSVQRTGKTVVPVNVLHEAKYFPTASEWTGLIGGWVAEGGNYQPYEVPLSAVKNGPADLRIDPIAEFNKKLQKHINEGGSKLEFLKKEHLITINRPISLVGTCRESIDFSKSEFGSGYETQSIPVTIHYKGDPDLYGGIQKDNTANDFAALFQVTSASVTPHVKDYVGECPVDLKFRLSMKAQGAGTVKFRLIGEKGYKGGVHTINFTKNDLGSKIYDFSHAIEGAVKGGISNSKLAMPQQPKGNINQLAVPPSAKKIGSWKVEVIEPQKMSSDISYYSWKCESEKSPFKLKAGEATPPKPAPGNLNLKAKEVTPKLQLKAN
ncbi:MAG: hypothetical protein JJ879_09980 [Sneathiella sp.]|nr:hypothetical protein [Sneathiella sp.]